MTQRIAQNADGSVPAVEHGESGVKESREMDIGDVLAWEYNDARVKRMDLEDIVHAALMGGYVNALEEWYDQTDATVNITIRYAGDLQTEITVTLPDREPIKVYGWHIQRAIAQMIEALAKLDCPTDDSFATDLLDELKKSDAILASRN